MGRQPTGRPALFHASYGGRSSREQPWAGRGGWLDPDLSTQYSRVVYSTESDLSRVERPDPVRPALLPLPPHPDITVETLNTPEMSGLRSHTWSRSPTRSFVRNFP